MADKKSDATSCGSYPAPGCSATYSDIEKCPVCWPILAFAHRLPSKELPRALEIMRLTQLLYAEIHKPNPRGLVVAHETNKEDGHGK